MPSDAKSPVAAAIYLRPSRSHPDAEQAQERACREWLTGHRWHLAKVYTDRNASASPSWPRPAYAQMLEDLHANHIGAVLTPSIDRLHRDIGSAEVLWQAVRNAHAQLATLDGIVDLDGVRLALGRALR